MRQEDYCHLLDTYVRHKLKTFQENALYQQGGVPLHISQESLALLGKIFGENWIGKYGPTNCPLDLLILRQLTFPLSICKG